MMLVFKSLQENVKINYHQTLPETVFHFPYPLAVNGVHGAQHKPLIRKFLWTLQEFIRLKYLNIVVTWNVIQHETFKVTTKGLKHVLLCYKNVNLHKKHNVTSSATRYVYDFLCTQFLIERLQHSRGNHRACRFLLWNNCYAASQSTTKSRIWAWCKRNCTFYAHIL